MPPHQDNLQTQGIWTPKEGRLHINLLELRTICSACAGFLLVLKALTVQVMMAITSAIFHINWKGGARSTLLCQEAVHFGRPPYHTTKYILLNGRDAQLLNGRDAQPKHQLSQIRHRLQIVDYFLDLKSSGVSVSHTRHSFQFSTFQYRGIQHSLTQWFSNQFCCSCRESS